MIVCSRYGGRSITNRDVTLMLLLKGKNMFNIATRYRKKESSDHIRYRKELKQCLIGLIMIYSGFTAWWMVINHITG